MNKTFDKLNKVNVNDYTEKKGQFTYLSWAWAVRELLKVAPDSTWRIQEYNHAIQGMMQPYMTTDAGCFVKVTVTVDGIDRTQVHPVLDNRNQTIKEPNAFQINTSIQRCLAKAIALHGLGLYIFAGEDLPTPPEPISNGQVESIQSMLKAIGDKELSTKINGQIANATINSSNISGAMAKLERLSSE
tara:strand:- start:48 stop:611 length:564 start_codon:yes stop_codon:yes gene_type:complete